VADVSSGGLAETLIGERVLMEPISLTLIALGSAAFGFFSRHKRSEAEAELRAAADRLRSAHSSYQRSAKALTLQLHQTAAVRASYMDWLMPRLIAAHGRLGGRGQPPEAGEWFNGKTLGSIRDLVRRARTVIVLPSRALDGGVMLGSGVAVLAQGVEHLDKIGFLNVPFLHENLHDVVAGLPIDGAGQLASHMGVAGVASVADVVSGVGIVFSVFRGGYNLFKAEETSQSAADLGRQADRISGAAYNADRMRQTSAANDRTVDEAAYQAFKWVWLAERLQAQGRSPEALRAHQGLRTALATASSRLWSSLQLQAA